MDFVRFLRPAAAGAILFLAIGASAPQRTPLTALGTIERGQWQLKDVGGTVRKLCLGNPAALLQLRHPGQGCKQVVIENTSSTATVTYDCPGHGNGRTSVTVETARLIRVETSGIVDGMPFAGDYEGRKVGTCS